MKPHVSEGTAILESSNVGKWCHDLARQLWPIPRSLTGPGTRKTLEIIAQEVPGLQILDVPSGEHAFDWEVPDEWVIRDAYLADSTGKRVIDFKENNLHVMGYSEPVDQWIGNAEVQDHLYSIPSQPDAIPYVTSYYKRRWGFCVSQTVRDTLIAESYRAVIDSDLRKGHLNYAELVIPGDSPDEVFISTYVCHPSMANNELSGPVVTTALAKWIQSLAERKFTYRIVFVPETIGSVVYLSKNLEHLKSHVRAGFNVTCIGDDRCYSFLPSRDGQTLSDVAARHVLRHTDPSFKSYSWLDRGSDERQYCAPGIDLPIATIMRSKYGEYPEYHTSLDDLDNVVTPSGLAGGFEALRRAIQAIEENFTPKVTTLGEPQLGKRGLYPDISLKGSANGVKSMMDMISYCDGSRSLLEIAEVISAPFWELSQLIRPLIKEGLIIDMSDAGRENYED